MVDIFIQKLYNQVVFSIVSKYKKICQKILSKLAFLVEFLDAKMLSSREIKITYNSITYLFMKNEKRTLIPNRFYSQLCQFIPLRLKIS